MLRTQSAAFGESLPVAIPDFQTVMFPLVEALADGQERTMRDLTKLLADQFRLTEQEREEVLPSGQQTIFSNRVAWAKSHLKAAGLLENPVRAEVWDRPGSTAQGRPCVYRRDRRVPAAGEKGQQ